MARFAAVSHQHLNYGIRPARAADATTLAAIDTLVNTSPWSAAQFTAACAEQEHCAERALVLEEGGEIAAFIILSSVLDETCIHNLAVQPQSQRAGLGRRLVMHALEWMRQQGSCRCVLEVRDSNRAARGLYEALGFDLDGIRRNYYPTRDGREDARLMSLTL